MPGNSSKIVARKENLSRRQFYIDKWDRIKSQLSLKDLSFDSEEDWLKTAFVQHELSFSQAQELITFSQRLKMWDKPGLTQFDPNHSELLKQIEQVQKDLLDQKPQIQGKHRPPALDQVQFKLEEKKGKSIRVCPAYSDDYSCCKLKVINIAENCTLGCSYCVLQVFYPDQEIRIASNLKKRLEELGQELDPNQPVRIGTGEYSDSLLWGNKEGLLEDLMNFARKNPQVCLELKTKSVNIKSLIALEVPANVVVSWSVNPDAVAQAEEGRAPSIEARLQAARKVADAGILVGFHFHPMVRYEQDEKDYPDLLNGITKQFKASEVAWISQGSLKFLKQHRDKLLKNHPQSKLLQASLEPDLSGKLGYTDEERVRLYRLLNQPFEAWNGKVFRYLCMEPQEIFLKVMGEAFSNNEEFEEAMNQDVMAKINERRSH